jgi:hypothetical protein
LFFEYLLPAFFLLAARATLENSAIMTTRRIRNFILDGGVVFWETVGR